MNMNRRRFLTISAAFAATPALAQSQGWQGRAFGAEVAIRLSGPDEAVQVALYQARKIVRQMEQRFSLFRPTSELVRLNRQGQLRPSAPFRALFGLADTAHRITGGLFDPTVQPLWHALAVGGDPAEALALIGWDRLSFDKGTIRLAPGQALTFNGIAQGFATDAVADALAGAGFGNALVNIGEYRATGGDWRLAVEDPQHGLLATRRLGRGAIATSSPLATPLGGGGHILHPRQQPQWSTVSVEAESAAMADALSTGLVLADMALIRKVRQMTGVRRIILVDWQGDLTTL
ncbi:FAD:protein FMN transferase [Sulfitobacter sp. G21635-S1]|uniref:FAD:protein FMN transferase n=1 Tax=Sulfitobacter sp. G21635-S1 TaxID=3014043 RepID=UPI0022B072DB|nr:FAD:protein FMN transferase [Sulfitobacter sp. G21635-S1]MCZ4255574.1 FAD:protein FMN transferase [Sulfitobacter sp. G21635-S1]